MTVSTPGGRRVIHLPPGEVSMRGDLHTAPSLPAGKGTTKPASKALKLCQYRVQRREVGRVSAGVRMERGDLQV
jgi:hypothetical protein